nr:HPr family phosphocarrier protein [uncultured Caproiciproducens sp.]
MFTRQFIIKNRTGLHARPAGQLATLCKSIPDDIRIIAGKDSINPKGILAILTAGLKMGTAITIEVEGATEQESGKKIITFLDGLTE